MDEAGGFSEKIDEGKGSNKEVRRNGALEQQTDEMQAEYDRLLRRNGEFQGE